MLKHLSKQALIILAVGLLVSLSLAFYKPEFIIPSFVVFLSFILAAYNINCTITGHCIVWSYFLVGIYLIYSSMILYAIYTGKLKVMSDY
jgi:hypothetical protein